MRRSFIILGSLAAIALLVLALAWKPKEEAGSVKLHLYCAAGIKAPVERIAKEYEAEYGVQVELDYGGSGTLLSKLKVAGTGDLYLAADDSYIEIAREGGFVRESIPLAILRPVIVVPSGNPKGIASIDDLLRGDIKLSLANPEAASVGKTAKAMLESTGKWEAISEAVAARGVLKPTVNEVANDVKLGASDAGITWDATANQYPELEGIALEESEGFEARITVGVLESSRNPTEALRFARYLGARDRGLVKFEEHGFPAVPGDKWSRVPKVVYFSGGVNRLAIEETIKEFEAREGCEITTVYNGCGILLGQIKLDQKPDGYHTCDVTFMKGVEDRFTTPEMISQTQIVIVTKPENPHGIQTLKDLDQAGLKFGIGNEEQSTLGALTAEMMQDQGIYEAILARNPVRVPTADFLISQFRTGALDAIVVYRANTVHVRDEAEIIEIADPRATAIQTIAIANDSNHGQLMKRLSEAFRSKESVERYHAAGFEWIGTNPTP